MNVLLIVGVIIVVILILRKNAANAKGTQLGNDYNIAKINFLNTINQIISESQKTAPNRLSEEQLNQLVEKAADDMFPYIQLLYQIICLISKENGDTTTKTFVEFLSEATAEFGVAIDLCVRTKSPDLLLTKIKKYEIHV